MIHYNEAPDIKQKIEDIKNKLVLNHINTSRVFCIRSNGSKSRGIIARCHSLPRIMQLSLGTEPAYIIEIISENFDKLSDEEQLKTLIHELCHIPKSFGGGFRHHNVVTKAKVERLFKKFKKL